MFRWFRNNKGLGPFLLRVFLGIRLICGVQDNLLHWEHMKAFENFLGQHHFPLPLVCAILSVYAQAVAGLLFLLGWMTRWAALLMIVNFIIALAMVHWGQSLEQSTTVLLMILVPMSLLFTGPGKFALDKTANGDI